MDSVSLIQLLFQNDKISNNSLEHLMILPNIMDGFDIRDSSGDVIAQTIHDVVGNGETIISDGESIGNLHDNVMGGTTIDMGMNHSINGQPNIYGGENFSDSMGNIIGHSQPNIEGGMDFISNTGQQISHSTPDILGGIDITSPISPELPDVFGTTMEATSHFDTIGSIKDTSDFTDAHDVIDGIDLLDELDFLTSWF